MTKGMFFEKKKKTCPRLCIINKTRDLLTAGSGTFQDVIRLWNTDTVISLSKKRERRHTGEIDEPGLSKKGAHH